MYKANCIRKAKKTDIGRISEIYVFNNRIEYYPIFNNTEFSFKELQVLSYANRFSKEMLDNTYLYDDGVIKGFILLDGEEINKLHVDSFFQNQGVGSLLIEYAKKKCNARFLWTLEKNERAIRFYGKHGFKQTGKKRALERIDGSAEYCVELSI